jgi:hypothetical protein
VRVDIDQNNGGLSGKASIDSEETTVSDLKLAYIVKRLPWVCCLRRKK